MREFTDLSLREQEARIRQLQADAMLKALDSVKRAQDIRFGPLPCSPAAWPRPRPCSAPPSPC